MKIGACATRLSKRHTVSLNRKASKEGSVEGVGEVPREEKTSRTELNGRKAGG